MARATRVDFPGAWYHVLNRGTERRVIFRSTRCYEKFIELLSSLPERFGVRLHGYALMGNHYHLQLESREANLSKAVHWLNVSYSVWFNRKYSLPFPFPLHPANQLLHSFPTLPLPYPPPIPLWNNTIGVRTLSSLEPEQHPPGYAPSPSWRSSVEARNASSKRRFVNSCGKRQP